MKYLKYLLYALVALILVLVGVGLFGPKTYHVERSVEIGAEASAIYQQISNFKNLNTWSPWNKYDTVSLKHTYEGTDGAVGSKTCWEGNDQVGSGCQTLAKLDPNKRVDIDLAFIKPFESQAKTYFEIIPSQGAQKVTWGMNGENNFISNIFGLFMDMDAMIGNDFESGLADLKKICESTPKTTAMYDIKEMDWETKTYIGIRKTLSFQDDFAMFLGSSYGELMATKPEMTSAPVGLYFTWDEKTQTTDMAAALPVKEAKEGKYEVFTLSANKAYVIEHYGAYEKTMLAHQALDAHLKTKGLNSKSPVIEEYITDPMSEKDTAKWLTKIYYLVD